MVTKSKERVRHELLVGKGGALTFLGDFIPHLAAELDAISRIKFPTIRYRDDPVRFCHEILGVDPWEKQIEILEAIRDHPRVAVKSGHKVSKSHSIGCCALWLYCSYEDAKVVLTSTTSRQVDEILWLEIRKLKARSGRCLKCKLLDPEQRTIPTPCPHSAIIPEEPSSLARTGLRSPDFRSISGFTAKEAEAVAGISGKRLWYFVDEASGIGNQIFEAMEGNRAGGARLAMFGNPTKNEGEFYDAFHTKKDLFKCITVSSEDTPNAKSGKDIIPGLAEKAWIDEKKEEWGEKSALYCVRVKGEFAEYEQGKIFSMHVIVEAEKRYEETPATGLLFLGMDPAGASGLGDESGFALRRGKKQLALEVKLGLSEEAHLAHALLLLKHHKNPREIPVVVMDREGQVGSRVYGHFKAHADMNPDAFILVGVRTSEYAVRESAIYGRIRDEVVANFESWLREGGAILTDAKLSAEMHAYEWKPDSRNRLRATDKATLKKILNRSPDRFDATCLSVWESSTIKATMHPDSAPAKKMAEIPSVVIDPYGSTDWARTR
jgi:phage terminase large subunit